MGRVSPLSGSGEFPLLLARGMPEKVKTFWEVFSETFWVKSFGQSAWQFGKNCRGQAETGFWGVFHPTAQGFVPLAGLLGATVPLKGVFFSTVFHKVPHFF